MSGRKVARVNARMQELVEELCIGAAIRLRTDSDQIRPVVAAVVAYLVEEYPSQDLYIPSTVTYPVEEIREDFKRMSIRAVCRKHRISRKTVYRLLDQDASA